MIVVFFALVFLGIFIIYSFNKIILTLHYIRHILIYEYTKRIKWYQKIIDNKDNYIFAH